MPILSIEKQWAAIDDDLNFATKRLAEQSVEGATARIAAFRFLAVEQDADATASGIDGAARSLLGATLLSIRDDKSTDEASAAATLWRLMQGLDPSEAAELIDNCLLPVEVEQRGSAYSR